ncbi:hypothetical protein ABK040_001824 [Willaertia magna]
MLTFIIPLFVCMGLVPKGPSRAPISKCGDTNQPTRPYFIATFVVSGLFLLISFFIKFLIVNYNFYQTLKPKLHYFYILNGIHFLIGFLNYPFLVVMAILPDSEYFFHAISAIIGIGCLLLYLLFSSFINFIRIFHVVYNKVNIISKNKTISVILLICSIIWKLICALISVICIIYWSKRNMSAEWAAVFMILSGMIPIFIDNFIVATAENKDNAIINEETKSEDTSLLKTVM